MAGTATNAGRWAKADVYVAPTGTTAPTDVTTAWAAGWVAVGFLDPDGPIVNALDQDSDTLTAWGGTPIESVDTFNGETFSFTAIEDNATVFGLIFEGSDTPTTASGVETRIAKVPSRGEHAFGIELTNGAKVKRIVIPRAKISEIGDRQFAETELTSVEITVNVLAASDDTLHRELTSA